MKRFEEVKTQMKTPAFKKLSRSVSDHRLHQTTFPLKWKGFLSKKENFSCWNQKLNVNKSETIIDTNLLNLERPTPVASNLEPQLIPIPKTPKHPKEVLRKSLIRIKSVHSNDSVLALQDIVQISRFNPQLLAKTMPAIYKGITTLLKSLRITAARTACQVANELFMNIPSDQGLEFDEMIFALLQKTIDPNEALRKDALEALDSMVIHLQPSYTIKILLHRRIAGCNANVRTTAIKLLTCVIGDYDAHSTTPINEELKTRLVYAAIRYLQDDNNDIKFHAIRLVTMLMQHTAFRSIFDTKFHGEALGQLENTVEAVKSTIRFM